MADRPTDPRGWFEQGEAHLRAGELSHAIYAYERALELQPDFPQATAQLQAANAQRDAGRWIVMRHDSYAREDNVIEECMTRAMAERRVRELNALGEDHHWCTATT